MRALALFATGLLGGCAASSTVQCAAAASPNTSKSCIFDPQEFRGFTLLSSRYESPDTRRFFFSIEGKGQSANIPIGSCVVCKFTDVDGKDVVRPYTPISTNDVKDHFELLVKKYPKGKMGNHIFLMREGETLLVKGPFQKFKYSPNQYTHIGMIAGGTGITPMYQLIRGVLDNPKDKTELSLIYANNSRKDILLANELITLQKTYSSFNAYLTLLDVPARWLGGVGYVNSEMIKTFMPKPNTPKTMILVCGPPPMMKAVSGDKDFSAGGTPTQGPLTGLLADLGYTAAQVYKY
jgi:cytochrome-b5 reductase